MYIYIYGLRGFTKNVESPGRNNYTTKKTPFSALLETDARGTFPFSLGVGIKNKKSGKKMYKDLVTN